MSIKPHSDKWKRGQIINLRTDKGFWSTGIAFAGYKARFSAGWNKFVRDNDYTAGQRLTFKMVELSDVIEFEIT